MKGNENQLQKINEEVSIGNSREQVNPKYSDKITQKWFEWKRRHDQRQWENKCKDKICVSDIFSW